MAPIIPELDLFIVTSALNATMGAVSREDRITQTEEGIKSLREKCPNAIIILSDGSPIKLEKEKLLDLSDTVNICMDWSEDSDIKQFAENGRKSEAENVLMIKTMMILKHNPDMMQLMPSVRRIYKLSGRTTINSGFDVNEHNQFGKYVFKKRMPTWISDDCREIYTDLLITRMFSLCPSLIDDYIEVCYKNLNTINNFQVDTEHAHFFNINKQYLVELDTIHCQGVVAGSGQTEVY
jgi:hypothetical protein